MRRPYNNFAFIRHHARVSSSSKVLAASMLTLEVLATGCSARSQSIPPPSVNATAPQVAHAVLAAYQAGDQHALRRLTDGVLARLEPGDLGRITHVRWLTPITDHTQLPGFAPGTVLVSFRADTTGSPDGTIPAMKGWTWGFMLARRSPTSPWAAVDDGAA